jgi:hypothetical protein
MWWIPKKPQKRSDRINKTGAIREGLRNEVPPLAFVKSRIDWIAGKIQSLEAEHESKVH